MVAIRTDGTLWGWGANTGYQLGNGTTAHRSSPVQIGTSSYTSVTAGGSFMAAIRTDGRLFVWGTNTTGQLGLGDTALRSQPTQINSTTSWSVVSASNDAHALAITTDGKLYAWGNNLYSQLGLSDTINRSSPVQVGISSWSTVSAGTNYSLGSLTDNTVWGWGDTTKGNLGIVNPLSWTSVGGTAAIHGDGSLWTWGGNLNGSLGVGDAISRSSPVQVGTGSWISVTTGGAINTVFMLAIRNDYTLWAWGYNTNGELGDGTTINRSSPVQVSGAGSWTKISARAAQHVLAI
jgi:alpha-tubulin suppressor-like RCC1 family protein